MITFLTIALASLGTAVHATRDPLGIAGRHDFLRYLNRAVPRPDPWHHAVASWYFDQGLTASGFHATYGVANLTLPFGTRVTFRYHSRQVTGTVDDRGPYVSGRLWDLSQSTAGALGFQGVDTVAYRVLR